MICKEHQWILDKEILDEENLVNAPTEHKIWRAVDMLKNNKAPEVDMSGELLKYGDDQLSSMLHKLILNISEAEEKEHHLSHT